MCTGGCSEPNPAGGSYAWWISAVAMPGSGGVVSSFVGMARTASSDRHADEVVSVGRDDGAPLVKSPARTVFEAFSGASSRTRPSISGASAYVRPQPPLRPSADAESTRTCMVAPTRWRSFSVDTCSATAMKRARRSSRTSAGTAPGISLATAPSTGE